MNQRLLLACWSLGLLVGLGRASLACANDRVPMDDRSPSVHYGGVPPLTPLLDIYLMGGPGTTSGKFQDATGTLPQWQGWIGVDKTQKTVSNWNISTFNAANLDPAMGPNFAMWCGQTFAVGCGGADPPEGYGNNWHEWLDWYGSVENRLLSTSVTVDVVLNTDTEAAHYDVDTLSLEYESAMSGEMETVPNSIFSGLNVGDPLNPTSLTFPVASTDYVGVDLDQVHLRWHAASNFTDSDEDCLWPTSGHSQIDNIRVSFDGNPQTYDDFQPDSPLHWAVVFPPSVGDFSTVWPRLDDIDICTSNNTPQMAFIDDGIVVPGTGGTLGTTWTYGPGGYTVNLLGGLAGPEYHLENEVWSPQLDWPTGQYYVGAFNFDVWRHLPLSNGLFYVWHVRSSTDGGLTWSPWRDDGFVYYSSTATDYLRVKNTITTHLLPGLNKIQVALGAIELGWRWGYVAVDGTPAPYFDNVEVVAPYYGRFPAISARDVDMFQDNFPTIPEWDWENPANNSVRVDRARNLADPALGMNVPGDDMVVDVVPNRCGSVLAGPPLMHVLMKANPIFDASRTLPPGFVQVGDRISGAVAGIPVTPTRWSFDLPDEHFFYPGDVFHYYISAQDVVAGDISTTTMPDDITAFALFPGDPGYRSLGYESTFKVRALPTMFGGGSSDQPQILFWNDNADRGGEDEWFTALDNLGYREGIDYDIFYTNGPSSGVGNGLGGRAQIAWLAGYSTLLYTSGDLSSYTLSNGDCSPDAGDDIAMVDAWLSLGGKNLFATGDNIIQDLSASGFNAVAFRNKWFSVDFRGANLRPLIGGQTSVTVAPIAVPGALVLSTPFTLFGGCPIINDFDAIAVTAPGTATKIAEFCGPTGARGAYPLFAAAVYNYVADSNTRVVFMPYDLQYIYNLQTAPPNPPKKAVGVATRTNILQDVLDFFGQLPGGFAVGVTPDAGVFTARNFPNPFNPSTKIEYSMPRDGQLTIKIYNVRGELVKTLLDEQVKAGTNFIIWNGDNDRGQTVGSGVYFYAARGAGSEVLQKVTLVK